MRKKRKSHAQAGVVTKDMWGERIDADTLEPLAPAERAGDPSLPMQAQVPTVAKKRMSKAERRRQKKHGDAAAEQREGKAERREARKSGFKDEENYISYVPQERAFEVRNTFHRMPETSNLSHFPFHPYFSSSLFYLSNTLLAGCSDRIEGTQ